MRGDSNFNFYFYFLFLLLSTSLLFDLILIVNTQSTSCPSGLSSSVGLISSPYFDVKITLSGSSIPLCVYFTSSSLMQQNNGPNVPSSSSKTISFFSYSLTKHGNPNVYDPINFEIKFLSPSTISCSSPHILPSRYIGNFLSLNCVNSTYLILSTSTTSTRPGQYCLFNGSPSSQPDYPLCIFLNPEYSSYTRQPNSIYFPSGVTTIANTIYVESGQQIYFEEGSHVMGTILPKNPNNCDSIRIQGNGILNGHSIPIYGVYDQSPLMIDMRTCSNVIIQGVITVNSPFYSIASYQQNLHVQWVKALAWGYSSDAFVGGLLSIIEDSFAFVNDDSNKLFFSQTIYRRLVLMQQENGCPFMLSWNTADEQSYITARENDIIMARHIYNYDPNGLFCSMHSGKAWIHHFLFDDIRIDSLGTNWPVGYAAFTLIAAQNSFGSGSYPGIVSNVIFRNIRTVGTATFVASSNQLIQLHGSSSSGAKVHDVTFDNCTVNGNPISSSMMTIDLATTSNIQTCAGCTNSVAGDYWPQQIACQSNPSSCLPQSKSNNNVKIGVGVGVPLLFLLILLLVYGYYKWKKPSYQSKE